MSRVTVERILAEIEALSDDDRAALECELWERSESQSTQALEDMRRRAAAQSVDQAAVDQAVERERYGR